MRVRPSRYYAVSPLFFLSTFDIYARPPNIHPLGVSALFIALARDLGNSRRAAMAVQTTSTYISQYCSSGIFRRALLPIRRISLGELSGGHCNSHIHGVSRACVFARVLFPLDVRSGFLRTSVLWQITFT